MSLVFIHKLLSQHFILKLILSATLQPVTTWSLPSLSDNNNSGPWSSSPSSPCCWKIYNSSFLLGVILAKLGWVGAQASNTNREDGGNKTQIATVLTLRKCFCLSFLSLDLIFQDLFLLVLCVGWFPATLRHPLAFPPALIRHLAVTPSHPHSPHSRCIPSKPRHGQAMAWGPYMVR